MNPPLQNPFTRPAFWGRQYELQTIYNRLLTQPPQCCAIIGETSFGKTTLLRHLAGLLSSAGISSLEIKDKFTFVYLDCTPYTEMDERGDYASTQFWWDLYNQLWLKLYPEKQPSIAKPKVKAGVSIDTAFEIKSELEDLIQQQPCPVVFLLDNFEGIARLPLRDSEWLRSLVYYNCAFVVASRHLLYLLYQYHPESWASPSPLWNLFSDPIYLGLISEREVQNFLLQASGQARKLGSCWEGKDTDFIRKISGRHPELIRIACVRLFEQRLQSDQSLGNGKDEFKDEFLELSIYRDSLPICSVLWQSLADPEFWNIPGVAGYAGEKESRIFSPYQSVLINVANGGEVTDKKVLFVLEQRGLIEWRDGEWHVFAEVMRQFVLEQEQLRKQAEQASSDQIEAPGIPAFAYREGKVYEYLKSHAGSVCDREEIKQAIWGNDPPTNSALQKIIERIREKIEPEPDNPRYLIAVRGQGYMLREAPSNFDIS